MKNKRIWLVILLILAAGISVTRYTRSVVKDQIAGDAFAYETSAAKEESEDIKPGETAGESIQEETGAETSPGLRAMPKPAAAAAMQAPQGEEEDAKEPAAVFEAVPDAAGDAAFGPGKEPAASRADSPCEGEIYRQRLNDLDAQIRKMQGEDKDSNVYSIKTSAETEVKMWDKELNTVYNALLGVLPQEEAEALAKEQNEWTRDRESAAAGQSGKGDGVGVSYAASLVELTRNRAYELADRYETAVCGPHDPETDAWQLQ